MPDLCHRCDHVLATQADYWRARALAAEAGRASTDRKWKAVCEAMDDLRKVDRATAEWIEAYCAAAIGGV